MMYLLAI